MLSPFWHGFPPDAPVSPTIQRDVCVNVCLCVGPVIDWPSIQHVDWSS